LNRESCGRDKIKTWDKLVPELKNTCFPMDYALNLLKIIQNLKKLMMLVEEYMKEFYRLYIRSRYNDGSLKSISKDVSGLSYAIQDEFHVLNFCLVAMDNQETFRTKEKLLRR